jgi:hypothetical protein
MFRMVRERLPEGELGDRVDLMEVAAEFHQEEVLVWLLRDATVFERELLGVFALERKEADSLVVALENGFHPWWRRTREVSLKWRAGAEMEFVSAPEGFSSEGGWWTSVSGATSALRGLGGEACLGSTSSDGRSRVEFEWTRAMSQAQLGDAKVVKSVVFPPGVTAIGDEALFQFEALESVVLPASCILLGWEAFAECKALKAVSLPVRCEATGHSAFADCESLVNALIPAGCVMVSDGCFWYSTSLAAVRFPDGLTRIGDHAFFSCALKEVTVPDGCQIGDWAFVGCKYLTKLVIGRSCTSIGAYAFSKCAALTKLTVGNGCASICVGAFLGCGALTTVTFGEGLTSIGDRAFGRCVALAAVTLPASVRSIGENGFGQCKSLAAIAVPEGCQLHSDAFWKCNPLMARF